MRRARRVSRRFGARAIARPRDHVARGGRRAPSGPPRSSSSPRAARADAPVRRQVDARGRSARTTRSSSGRRPRAGPRRCRRRRRRRDVVTIHQRRGRARDRGGRPRLPHEPVLRPMPTLARETHSRDASGRSWRTRCSTPPSDPRRATMNTLVIATQRHAHRHRRDRPLRDHHRGRALHRGRPRARATFDLVAPRSAPPRRRQPRALRAPAVATAPPARSTCTRRTPRATRPALPRASRCVRRGSSCAPASRSSSAPVVLDANGCATGTATTWTRRRRAAGTTLHRRPLRPRLGAGRCGGRERAGRREPRRGGARSVTVDVTSPAHYDELLAQVGPQPQGENESASVADLATGSIGAARARAEDTREAAAARCSSRSWAGSRSRSASLRSSFARAAEARGRARGRAEEAYEERIREADQRASARSARPTTPRCARTRRA